MKLTCLAILLFISTNTSWSQEGIEAINNAFANSDMKSAFNLSDLCYSEDTTNIHCLRIAAKASYALGDQATAKAYYHLLEEKDSSNTHTYIQLANIYDQQGQMPKAIKYYTKLNKMLPENSVYFRKNAKLYLSYGDKMEAFRLYAKANKLNPKDVLTIKGLSEISLSNNQFTQADSLMNIGLNQDSMNIGLNYLMARSKYKQKQYDSVTMVFHRIIGQVDLNSYYNKMLGYAYLQIDSIDLAISKLQLALVDDENSEKLHYYLATAYEKKGNQEGALDHYQKAVASAISPDLDLYHRNVGRLAVKNKAFKTAISAYKDAYKYGEDPVVLYYLAAACDNYYKDKNIAINYYKKYLKSNHTHQEYRDYAEKRVRYLKEIQFQGG